MITSGKSPIQFGRSSHVALHYYVLSHIDLGRDAANLFVPRSNTPDWAEALSSAYQTELPHSLILQFLPLKCQDHHMLLERLRAEQKKSATMMANIHERIQPHHAKMWEAQADTDNQKIADICDKIAKPLAILRTALWARIHMSPVPLTVLHAASIGHSGRAAGFRNHRVVAVSFALKAYYVLFQIFHEETHVVSDRLAQKQISTGEMRSTRFGDDGYEIHRILEKEAVLLGREIVQDVLPGFLVHYENWATANGMFL